MLIQKKIILNIWIQGQGAVDGGDGPLGLQTVWSFDRNSCQKIH